MSKKHGRYITPECIHGISPTLLLLLLEPHRVDLVPIGVLTPQGVNLDVLNRLLEGGEHAGLPHDLLEQLSVVQEMGTVANADEMLQCARAGGAAFDQTASASDLAVHLILHRPVIISRLVAKQRPMARRKFRTFPAADADFSNVKRVEERMTAALRDDLDSCLVVRGRCRGTEVHEFESPGGFRLMIRRGELLHREPTFEDSTAKRRIVSFHPERFDIIIYDSLTRELHISAQQEADVTMYREKIGQHVFGQRHLFLTGGSPNIYTLHPILVQGRDCLRCDGIQGLRQVELQSLSLAHPDHNDFTSTHESKGDLFTDFESTGKALAPRGTVPFAAKFRVTFEHSRRPAMVKLSLPNNATFARDGDGILINSWLSERGFRTHQSEEAREQVLATA